MSSDDTEIDALEDAPEDSNAALAELLGIDERVLITSIGGPWHECPLTRVEMSEAPEREYRFIGRSGLSAILILDAHRVEILVGMAEGTWQDPGTIVWTSQAPRASIPIGRRWLDSLATAVDEACKAKADSLITCRYCGSVTGPEFAWGSECCSGCASRHFDVTF